MSNDSPQTAPHTSGLSGSGKQNPLLRIPDHELLRCIGSGSYGEVWLARSVMGTYRAVKVVYRQTFRDERPYEREFGGIQKFEPVSRSHEGLVDILQVGRNDQAGYFYYVMELGDDRVLGQEIVPESYEPKTLGKEVAHRGKLPFNECLQLSLSLTSAVGHLHKHHLIHRDIKPSNIIFVNGLTKIADIGLVADLGTAGSFVGTPGYIPPEGPATAQGDIFSLGKVLYEMSTGKDRRSFPELPTQLVETSHQRELLELNEVILKACEADPRKRYQSTEQMHADLVLLQAGKSVKRLRVLEQRMALVTRISLIAAVIMLVVYYQIYRENKRKTQQLAASYVAYGTRSMDEGDLIGSLPWFADALQLEQRNPHRAEVHRVRLGAILRQCPKIVQMWFQNGQRYYAEFSRDGRRIVTAGADGTVRICDPADGGSVSLPLGQGREVNTACFSRDQKLIVTADTKGRVVVWDAATGKSLHELQHPDGVLSAQFNGTGDLVVTACSDAVARVWKLATGETISTFEDHTEPIRSASFSPDGQRIVTASQDGTVQVWLTATGERVGKQPIKHKSWVYYASFSPDGRYVVSASFDRTAQIFDTQEGRQTFLSHPAPVHSAEFSPDGRYIVTACWDYTARLWNAATGEPVISPLKHNGNVMHASFSPEGRRIVTVTTLGVTTLWDLAPNNWLPPATRAYFSRDGNSFATMSNDWVQVWDATSSNAVSPSLIPANSASKVELSQDGNSLVTISTEATPSGNATSVARVWESSTGKALSPPFSLGARVTESSLSPDRQHLLTVVSNVVEVWLTSNGQRVAQFQHSNAITEALFNAAGNRITIASKNSAYIRDLATGRTVGPLLHAAEVLHAEVSPDGRWLVTACSDTSLAEREGQVWDAQTGRKVGHPLKHRDGVRYASFSADSGRVVTASEDRTAQVWDAALGTRIGPPLWHKDEVWKAAFSPDGRRIVTVCRDATARVWDSTTGEPLTPPLKAPSPWSDRPWHAQFTGDGQGIIASRGGEAHLYSLLPDQREIKDLVLIAQLLSGHQSDQLSGATPLAKEVVAVLWQSLSSREPQYLSTPPEEALSWHQREAEDCERAKQWFAGKFHIEQVLQAKPNDADLQKLAARLNAEWTASRQPAGSSPEKPSKHNKLKSP